IKERWPGLHGEDLEIGYYEKNGGVIMGENAIRTYRRLALSNGAELLVDTSVTSIHPEETQIRIETEHDGFTADKLILSSGGHNGRMRSEEHTSELQSRFD